MPFTLRKALARDLADELALRDPHRTMVWDADDIGLELSARGFGDADWTTDLADLVVKALESLGCSFEV